MAPLGILIIVATTIFPAFQLWSLPNVSDQVALFSQFLGLAALILMAWGQILATRLPGIETVFGGLDRVYVLHKWSGIVAMAAILLHDTIDAEMRDSGPETFLSELAETLGEMSLYGLLILVVISVATFVPYHLWKWTHKVMGALFAAGVFHFVFIMKPFALGDPAGLYTGAFCTAGVLAYLWTLLPDTLRPSKGYKISGLDKSGGALVVSMAPKGKGITPVAGQFGVLSFAAAGKSEPHPFSFSSIGPDGALRVTIKALGDFTTGLERGLAVGQDLRIQGPFGRFRLGEKAREVWVAGGIGITPFLAGAQALKAEAGVVDLFYCIRSRDAAPHLAELQAMAKAKPNLRLHLMVSSEGQRVSADKIAEVVGEELAKARVAFCGPVALREALKSGLARYGVSARQFHYEEFEFRTGIGLQRLAAWVLRRGLEVSRQARRS